MDYDHDLLFSNCYKFFYFFKTENNSNKAQFESWNCAKLQKKASLKYGVYM